MFKGSEIIYESNIENFVLSKIDFDFSIFFTKEIASFDYRIDNIHYVGTSIYEK